MDVQQQFRECKNLFADLEEVRGRTRLHTARQAESERTGLVESRILKRLWHPTKDDRKETIAKAHESNFRYMYQDALPGLKP